MKHPRLHAGATDLELLQVQSKWLDDIQGRLGDADISSEALDRLLRVARGLKVPHRRPRRSLPDRDLVRMVAAVRVQHGKLHRLLLGEKAPTCVGDRACVEKHRGSVPALSAHARVCQLLGYLTDPVVGEFAGVVNALAKSQARPSDLGLPDRGKGAVAEFLIKEAGLSQPEISFLLVAHAAGWKLPVHEVALERELPRIKVARQGLRRTKKPKG